MVNKYESDEKTEGLNIKKISGNQAKTWYYNQMRKELFIFTFIKARVSKIECV